MQLNKSEFQKHLKENLAKVETKPHEDILQALLVSMEKVDFMAKAFPEIKKLNEKINVLMQFLSNQSNKETPECKSKREEMKTIQEKITTMKLKEKHFLIISVEEILKKAKSQKLGLCLNGNFVYLYNGEFWKSIEQKTIENFLGEASQVLGIEKFTAKYFNFRERLYKQFTASGHLPTPPKPRDKVLINLKNGTFEISERPILRSFDPSDFIRYQLPFEYNPMATAPKFEAYLNRVLPEKDKQEVLCEYLGYIFIPTERLKLEKALFLYGGGANGKSVLYDIIRALLGDQNTSEYSLQSLTDISGYSRAQIADKLVNYATEINGRLESSKFKALASGEPMEARLPYKDPFIIENYAKLIFNANELPKEVEFTHGFFRRFLIIPFEVTIPEKEQNKGLAKEIIQEELPGVFNWVLTGLKRLLANGKFSKSPSIDKALEDFKTESDSVKRFLQENGFVTDLEKKILLKDLYPQYREFALEDGNKPLSKSNFKKRLEANRIFVNREGEGLQIYISQKNNENGNPVF